jgi:hypothetical protein
MEGEGGDRVLVPGRDQRPWRAMDDERGDLSIAFDAHPASMERQQLITVQRTGGEVRIRRGTLLRAA